MVNVTATTPPEVYSLVGKNGTYKNDQKQGFMWEEQMSHEISEEGHPFCLDT